ncbi:MAG: winged helix-turn-helix domain-containing tetratricopeptide repeat protein [Pseudomonadota bacterium]
MDVRKETPFCVADWQVDPASGRIGRHDNTVKLEPRVMDVLVYLAGRPGQVVTREELEAAVWGGRVISYDALTSTVQKLRKAFADNARQPRIIETLSKKGYRLVAPVHLVKGSSEAIQTPSTNSASARSLKRLSRRGVAALLAVGLVVTGTLLWIGPWKATDDTVAMESSPRSIAVLPFDNLSGDPEQEYFADGMTDDLITGLAKNSDLLVIARDSTFVYKDQLLDIRQVAENLNVRFILHGSVRRVGETVRINAQLIDASNNSHLWAESYDGQMNGIFHLQDEITKKIVSTLAVRVSTGERQDLGLPHTNNPEAYDKFLNGRQRFYLYAHKEENQKSRKLFQRAIEFDPKFALAYAMLAWTHAFDAMNGWSDRRDRSLKRAQELTTKAIELQQAIPVAYFVRGLAYRERGDYVKALVEAEKAIALDPNYANAHVLLATLLYYAGRPQEGLERIIKAMQINPHHPYNYTFHLGQAYFILERYNEAIETLEKGIASNPASERLHVWLAAAYAQAGEIEEAEWEVDQILMLNPDFSLQRIQQAFPFKDPTDLERLLDGLRIAGLSQ